MRKILFQNSVDLVTFRKIFLGFAQTSESVGQMQKILFQNNSEPISLDVVVIRKRKKLLASWYMGIVSRTPGPRQPQDLCGNPGEKILATRLIVMRLMC